MSRERMSKARLKVRFLAGLGFLASIFLFQNCGLNFGNQDTVGFSGYVNPDVEGITPICRELTPGSFGIKLSHHWSGSPQFPLYDQIMSSPTVGDLDQDGTPEIVFVTFPDSGRNFYERGVLRVINGLTKEEVFSVGDFELRPLVSTPLLIDIDGNGRAEIIYPGPNNQAIALNYDGTLRWKIAVKGSHSWSGFAAFDLFNDGRAEIITGSEILREYKTQGGGYHIQKIPFNHSLFPSHNAFVKPIDGKPVIVSSLGAWEFDGQVARPLLTMAGAPCGNECYPAVADLNKASPGEEFIYTGKGLFRVYSQGGQLLVDKNLTEHLPADRCGGLLGHLFGTVGGGQATVGNFDSNEDTVEVAVATGKSLTIFDSRGNKIGGSSTQDCSSKQTGVTSFDFNGDGTPEILYSDELKFRIYKISEGGQLEVIWEIANTNGTLSEYPVVADVTGDARPEILVVSNDYDLIKYQWPNPIHGLRIFEAPSDDPEKAWMPTRSLWNQHAYYVYNVTNNLLATNASVEMSSSLKRSFKRNLPEIDLRCKEE